MYQPQPQNQSQQYMPQPQNFFNFQGSYSQNKQNTFQDFIIDINDLHSILGLPHIAKSLDKLNRKVNLL